MSYKTQIPTAFQGVLPDMYSLTRISNSCAVDAVPNWNASSFILVAPSNIPLIPTVPPERPAFFTGKKTV